MIVIKNLSKSLYGKVLFQDLNLVFNDRVKTGIIGPNGAGKSTLLKIIAGDITADAGDIQAHNEIIGYLPQQEEFDDITTIEDFLLLSDNPEAWIWLSKFDLAHIDTASPVSHLSGGQKTKISLVKVLAKKPTLLLMDEPTNNLDSASIAWLSGFIKDFRGSAIIVSHDRAFLNSTVNHIIDFDPANHIVEEYNGNFNDYVIEHAIRREQWQSNYDQQQKEKKHLEERLALKRQEASVYDSPAKGRQVRMIEKRIQREIYDKEISAYSQGKSIKNIKIQGESNSGKLILRAEHIWKYFNEKTVLCNITLEVRGKDRVHLAGINGSGKSTLLRIILGELTPDHGSITIGDNVTIGYFSQNQGDLNTENSVLEEFLNTKNIVGHDNARGILGKFLFAGDDIYKKVGSLSFGERVRLSFAKLVNQQNKLLILDEPTNHLDIPSREVIERALRSFEGALLIVSHDKYFIDQLEEVRELIIERGVVSDSQ